MPAVEIPERMRRLPRDKRGYPVPFMAFVEEDGTPHFAINDRIKFARIVRGDLCSICGTKLLRGRWFVGGPQSAFHEHGAYLDMPMHDECAHYALRVCPYIAVPRFTREIGAAKAKRIEDAIVTTDSAVVTDRPEVFVAVMAVGQRMVGEGGRYAKPSRPYRKVEFWRHGQQLTEDDAAPYVVANLQEIEA